MLYYGAGSTSTRMTDEDLRNALHEAFDRIGRRHKVIAVPPDITRFHSRAGLMTQFAHEYYGSSLTDILPALGTHTPMTDGERVEMFGHAVPADLFRVHRFRTDIVTLGEVPADYVEQVSEGKLSFTWPAQMNRLVANGGHDLVLSLGQVVPHEVIGMANYNKNIFVGTGGSEGINKSHYLGAVYGMERIMGRADNPVRQVLNYAHREFASHLPIVFAHTVVGREEDGSLGLKGLFVGDDDECFVRAAELSLQVNFTMVDEPFRKVVVHLDPQEFRSTWLGNKSVYRTRMAIADGGELVVLAPGVKEFGEDREIDELIRRYGYVGTDPIIRLVEDQEDLRANLSAAAHLIHGSSDDRFTITYCPGHLSKQEVESVNFRYGKLDEMMRRYDPERLKDGYNTLPDGEEIYYVSNPAVGLWAHADRFNA